MKDLSRLRQTNHNKALSSRVIFDWLFENPFCPQHEDIHAIQNNIRLGTLRQMIYFLPPDLNPQKFLYDDG